MLPFLMLFSMFPFFFFDVPVFDVTVFPPVFVHHGTRQYSILPVNCLDWEVCGVGEEVIVVGGRVDDDVEAGGHLRRDDDAESRHDGVNVACVFAAGIEDDVFTAK